MPGTLPGKEQRVPPSRCFLFAHCIQDNVNHAAYKLAWGGLSQSKGHVRIYQSEQEVER